MPNAIKNKMAKEKATLNDFSVQKPLRKKISCKKQSKPIKNWLYVVLNCDQQVFFSAHLLFFLRLIFRNLNCFGSDVSCACIFTLLWCLWSVALFFTCCCSFCIRNVKNGKKIIKRCIECVFRSSSIHLFILFLSPLPSNKFVWPPWYSFYFYLRKKCVSIVKSQSEWYMKWFLCDH